MIAIAFEVKKLIIDHRKMKRKADTAKRRAMVKQLAFIRTNARTRKLRRRKKPSAPGKPPSVHAPSGQYATLKNIRFDYSASTHSGVVGPVIANQVNFTDTGNRPVPSILETGGTIQQAQVFSGGEWWRSDLRRRVRVDDKRPRRVAQIRIAARPFMVPAMNEEISSGHIMEPWVNVITE